MNYFSITVAQAKTLIERAEKRGHDRFTWYDLPGVDFIVEVAQTRNWDEEPNEQIIYPDGSLTQREPFTK